MKYHALKWIGTVLFVTMLIMIPYAKAAADNAESNQTSPRRFEPVTVEAQRVPQREDLDVDSITNPYRVEASARFGAEVFTREDIQNLKPADVNDLLDKATGLNVTYQGRKSPYSINQRGGGSFTYIIDGAVLPSSTNRILYKIPLAAIEELQIVRGSTSLTLGPSINIGSSSSGSGLNTGYIIIRTRQPQKTQAVLTGSVEKSSGHPAETNMSLYAGTKLELSSELSGHVGGLVSRMDRPSQDSWFDGRDSENAMLGTGFRAGKFNLNAMAYTDSGRFEMQRGVTLTGALANDKWYYDPLKTTVLSSDMGMQWTPNQMTILNLFKTKYDQEEHNESFASSTAAVKEYEEETSGFGLRHNARFGNTLFQLGGQLSNSEGFGPNTSNSYNKYDTTVTGWSASMEQKFLDGRLIFDGGYRQDTKHIDNSSTSAAKNNANNDVDMAPSKVFALGSHWRITDTYVVDGRYYYGDQGTSGDFDMRSQTGSLHGEEQDRIEVALEANYAPYFKPGLTWFSIDAENAKSATTATYVLDGGTYYYYTEADELRRGVELTIKGDIGRSASYKLSWTRMLDNESTSNGVTTDANGVSNPENLYAIDLNYRWHAYRANLSIRKVDEWVNTSSAMGLAQSGGLGDYTRVDANIQREFKFGNFLLTAALYGRNLGDDNYSTRYVTGFYPDRGLTVGTELSFAY